jgi:putative inorganic carbon (HCO3(-)) transporter
VTARLEPTEWIYLAGLTFLAVLVGLTAGFDPKLAIVAALGFGFVLLVFMDLALGLTIFTLLSFLEQLPGLAKLSGALLALAWLGVVATRADAKSDFLSVHPGISATIGAFLGWVLLSSGWAEDSGAAIESFLRFLLLAILFLIVFTAVRSRRHVLMVAGALLAGAVAISLFGLLTGAEATSEGRLGAGGVGDDPNGLAAALVVGLALSVGVAANLRRQPGLRLAAIAAGGFCVLGLFLTASRGGLVALGVALIASLFLAGRWRGRITVAVALITVTTVYYFVAVAPEEDRQRIQDATNGQTRVQEGRTTIWEVGERMARANFVKGVGAGNFRVSSRHYLLEPGAIARSDQVIDRLQVAHNSYLEVWSELGIVGLTLFMTIIVFSLTCSVRAAREYARLKDRGGEILARAMAIALIGNLATAFFLSQEYDQPLWILLGLGPALLAIARSDAAKADG